MAADDWRHAPRRPRLTKTQVLAWADAHHRRTGRWPNQQSGPILEAPGETWGRVNWAMAEGYRGFHPGWSLYRFLSSRRKLRRYDVDLPRLTIPQILAWADSYHAKKGKWPRQGNHDETIEPPYVKWITIDHALARGKRGLRGGATLAGLLWEHRGVFSSKHTPRLTIRQILAWADAHHRRTGRWPCATPKGLPVFEDPRENWSAINACLRGGLRGLPGGDTLATLLYRRRDVENNFTRPPFTIAKILKWAREFHRRTGRWPQAADGTIPGTGGDTWMIVHQALNGGHRGLPGHGDTLARLLKRVYGVPVAGRPANLKVRQLLAWADAFYARTRQWPRRDSGAVRESPGDTWIKVDVALRNGLRGMPGGSTLHRFLVQHGRGNVSSLTEARRRDGTARWLARPPLHVDQIVGWADEYFRRVGRWPTVDSGAIPEAERVTWRAVDLALRKGGRGLPEGSSLPRLLVQNGRGNVAWRPQHDAQGRFLPQASHPDSSAAGAEPDRRHTRQRVD